MESIENHTAYGGGSLLKIDTLTENECLLECQKDEDCKHWTFRKVPEDHPEVKKCRLKASVDPKKEIQNVYSGPAFCLGTHEGAYFQFKHIFN